MIMWDPETYPDVKTIADLGKAGADRALLRRRGLHGVPDRRGHRPGDQADGSYDGTPAKFVVARGKDAQQGFASAEPYIYENEVAAWGKPVDYQLIHDAGYPIYAVRGRRCAPATSRSSAPCLKKLVPVLQQAEVDYFADPAADQQADPRPGRPVRHRLGLLRRASPTTRWRR